MTVPLDRLLTPEKALIFRITHRKNVPWILGNGFHCGNGERLDPEFVSIGNPDLIEKRRQHPVPIEPGDTLGDYIPFYFTPCSPMMYNVRTGYGGIRRRKNSEIVVFVSSLRRLAQLGVPFVFTDRHAYLKAARFENDLSRLDLVDWQLLQNRDFQRNPENPESFERYQAEALVHRHLPVRGLEGLACYNEDTLKEVQALASDSGLQMPIAIREEWYFS